MPPSARPSTHLVINNVLLKPITNAYHLSYTQRQSVSWSYRNKTSFIHREKHVTGEAGCAYASDAYQRCATPFLFHCALRIWLVAKDAAWRAANTPNHPLLTLSGRAFDSDGKNLSIAENYSKFFFLRDFSLKTDTLFYLKNIQHATFRKKLLSTTN